VKYVFASPEKFRHPHLKAFWHMLFQRNNGIRTHGTYGSATLQYT
jgi:hypothetical protein